VLGYREKGDFTVLETPPYGRKLTLGNEGTAYGRVEIHDTPRHIWKYGVDKDAD
jgi:hypothetical protein